MKRGLYACAGASATARAAAWAKRFDEPITNRSNVYLGFIPESIAPPPDRFGVSVGAGVAAGDRKSTRLNSSHRTISYAVFCLIPRPPRSSLFPYTTLFRSVDEEGVVRLCRRLRDGEGSCVGEAVRRADHEQVERVFGVHPGVHRAPAGSLRGLGWRRGGRRRSEEHTSELQSPYDLVCRLLLDPSTTEIFTLSLHDALPICR